MMIIQYKLENTNYDGKEKNKKSLFIKKHKHR